MQYQHELKALIRVVRNWILLIIVSTVFFFTVDIKLIEMKGIMLPVPTVGDTSFSARVLIHMVDDVAPEGVPLIVTEPLAAFVAQFKVAFLLACIFTLPVGLFTALSYLRPALSLPERLLFYSILIPTSLLFILGNLFAYWYILPTMFSVLYMYAVPLGATMFVSVSDFVGLSIALMAVSGLLFTLPVGMFLLTLLGLVSRDVWFKQWRYAAVIFLILSAIITPDGSGVTMVLLTIPLSILYGIGALVSLRLTRKRDT